MANLSEQKIKEMEAEMNRFEAEIETAVPDHIKNRIIIGAQTYNKVQDQLSCDIIDKKIPGLCAPPPPPPPELLPKPGENNAPLHAGPSDGSSNVVMPLLPPPPPPPSLRPSFVPPQLRQRPMGPIRPLNMPPRPIPGQFGAPLPPRMGTPAYGVQTLHAPPQNGFSPFAGSGPPAGYVGPPTGANPAELTAAPVISCPPAHVVDKPKVVYSAPPVRLVPKSVKKKSEKKKADKKVESDFKPAEEAKEAAPIEEEPIEMELSAVGDVDLDDMDEASKDKKKDKKKKFVRTAAGQVWEDPSLLEWDPDDFRMFCGDLGNEVTDDALNRAFSRYPSFKKAKVVRDKRTNKTKGYGFASFSDPNDFARAMREMNGKYVGNRPIKLRKSNWKDRNLDIVRRKEKEKKRLGFR